MYMKSALSFWNYLYLHQFFHNFVQTWICSSWLMTAHNYNCFCLNRRSVLRQQNTSIICHQSCNKNPTNKVINVVARTKGTSNHSFPRLPIPSFGSFCYQYHPLAVCHLRQSCRLFHKWADKLRNLVLCVKVKRNQDYYCFKMSLVKNILAIFFL